MKQFKQQLVTLLFFAAGIMSYAQVGVGTTSPTTSLDVVGANHTTAPGALASTDGVTVPRVSTDMTASPVSGATVGQLVYSGHASSTGFYFWDGDSWEPLVASPTTSSSKSARVADSDVITNADLNNYVIALVNRQFDLTTLTPSEGDIINFIGANSTGFGVSGAHISATTSPFAQGGGISYIYDAETEEWYSFSGF
tara:strand:+ start:1029 stop:1619 length:591 start_codon:yes stop_codon:yes gene_type:complete